jgi:flagellar biosynthetic protein FliO
MPTLSSAWQDVGLALNVIVKLGVVLALVYASLFALRRWQNGGFTSARRQLAVVETMRLSPRQALHLVRVGEQVWLIGATDAGLSRLGEVPAGQAALAELTPPTPSGDSIQAAFRRVAAAPAVANFAEVLRARLPGQAKGEEL